jgi:RimJ/RimL family protein N-acetyltransferase
MRNAIMIGERVYLRPLEAADAEALARITATETDTFMYRGRAPYSPLTFGHWIERIHKQQPPDQIQLAVCLVADDRCIGMVGLGEIDYVHRTAETSSDIGPAEYRGQGYGTEAKHLLLAYAFDRVHLHALWSVVFEHNTRSVAALAKQGYKPAGRLKWVDVQHGVYHDAVLFDLLRDEWVAARDAWRASRAATGAES